MDLESELDNISEVNRKEIHITESLIERLERFDHLNEKLKQAEIEDLIKLQRGLDKQKNLLERIPGKKTGPFSQLIIIKELSKAEEYTQGSLADIMKEAHQVAEKIDENNLDDELFASEERSNTFHEAIEKIAKEQEFLDKNWKKLQREVKKETEESIENRITEAERILEQRPTVLIEKEDLIKLIKKSEKAINKDQETGGFLHYEVRSGDIQVRKFFHEENFLERIEVNDIQSWRQAGEIFGDIVSEEELMEIKKNHSLESFIKELKEDLQSGTSYSPSPQTMKMLKKFHGSQNILTWHNHPPKGNNNVVENSMFYGPSETDQDFHRNNLSKILGRYIEIIVNPYPSGDPIPAPCSWNDHEDKQTYIYLPIWVTENGRKLSRKQVDQFCSEIIKYNQAIVRAEAAGRRKYVPEYIDDEVERISDFNSENFKKQGDYIKCKSIVQLFRNKNVNLEKVTG